MNILTSVILVSFKSNEIIENAIKAIGDDNLIFIVENSKNYDLKILEKKYSNLKVIINENNGFGNAANIAANLANTKNLLFLSPDTIVEKNALYKIHKIAEKFQNDFGLLIPSDIKNKPNKTSLLQKPIGTPLIFVNRNKFLKIGGFDENFFLYYEDIDLQLRFLRAKEKIFKIDVYFQHLYGSHDKKFNHEIEINRNWHYMWSRFYFIKKSNSYFYALIATLPTCLRALTKLIYYYLKKNDKHFVYKGRFLGLINAYLKKKSWYRPNI